MWILLPLWLTTVVLFFFSTDFDNLIDFVKYYNYENGDKLQDVEDMPLKVRNALREKTWNRSSVSFVENNLPQ